MSDETDFRTYLALNAADRYDTSPSIIDLCRKTLFVQNYVPCWESYVWYLESTASSGTNGRQKAEEQKTFVSLNRTNHGWHREILQQYTETVASDIRMFSFYYYHKVLKHKRIPYVYRKRRIYCKRRKCFCNRTIFPSLRKNGKLVLSSFNMKVNAVRDLQEYLLVSEPIKEPFMRSDYYLKKQGALKPKQDISEADLQVLVNDLKHFPENIRLMRHDSAFYGNTKIQFVSIDTRTEDIYWEEDSAWMRVKDIAERDIGSSRFPPGYML